MARPTSTDPASWKCSCGSSRPAASRRRAHARHDAVCGEQARGTVEQRLGTRLLQRSTRQLQLTPEGCAFYEQGLRVLADLEEAERCASAHAEPRGRLRVNSNVPFGQHFLLPLLPAFLARNPQVGVDLTLNDEVIDLLEQRTDVAVRAGPLKSSSLVARRLGATRMMIVAARRHTCSGTGCRATPTNCSRTTGWTSATRAMQGWPLLQEGARAVLPSGNARASNGDALRQLVLGGLGMARLAAFQVQDDVAAGRLLPVLEEANPGDLERSARRVPGAGRLPAAAVRAFLDFLVEQVDLTQPRVGPAAGRQPHDLRPPCWVAGQRPALPRGSRAYARLGRRYTCSSLRGRAFCSLHATQHARQLFFARLAVQLSTALWVMPSTGALLTR